MRKILSVALAAVAAAAVSTSGASAAAGPQRPAPEPLRWGACPAGVEAPGLKCATLRVPLDYDNPRGRKIEIEISRLASKKPAQRRGVLLTNPGGPASGLDLPATMAKLGLPQRVLDRYDVIGFDPRGIGHSTPVTCDLTPAQLGFGNIPPYPKNAADVTKRAADSKKIAEQCATSKTASMLPFISTANAARDMDRIRAALGEQKISYNGLSWGTHLGAVYTTLFPRRSDRFVLDSNLGPAGWDYPSERLWGKGVQQRFPDFAKFVAANDAKYGLGGTPREIRAKFFELAERLDRKPIEAPDGRFDDVLFRALTFGLIYNDRSLPALAAIWQSLDANQVPQAPPGGTLPDAENLISGRYYMICNDSRWPTSVRTYQRAVAVDRVKHPMFGAAAANVQPCAFWPDAKQAPVRVGDQGPSNVLLVQNLRDPATPMAGARKLRAAFGERARMLTVDQGGHGAYLFGPKNTCVNDIVTDYLAGGERPATDRFCAAEPQQAPPSAR